MTLALRAIDVSGAGTARASRLLWDIDWTESLPRTITADGVELRSSTIEAVLPFISAHYAEIFEDDPERHRFFAEPFDGPKVRYYQSADVFEIRHGDRTVGLVVGAPTDWSTYYIRTMAVLPAYQGRQLPRVVLPLLFERLKRAAVRRVEAETSPSNLVTIHVLTRMRFNITGNALSDRWGALLRMTKYLDRDAEDVFLDTFCVGIPYQLRRAESDNNKP